MTTSLHRFRQAQLRARAAPLGLALALLATPAFAQAQTAAPPPAPAPADQATDATPPDIVVTGTLFRSTRDTVSPITTLSAENLGKAGITAIAGAVRSISADNSGSIPSSFANGYGSGGAGVSMRGLTFNSTLELLD